MIKTEPGQSKAEWACRLVSQGPIRRLTKGELSDGEGKSTVWGLKYSTLMCAFYSINVYALSIRGLLHTVKTSSKRLHYLTVMTRHNTCGWPHLIYTTLIRPCLEYSSVPLVGFSKKQQAELERVQTHACKIIRRRAENISQPLPSLQTRREEAVAVRLVRDMHDEQRPLHDLLPLTRPKTLPCMR